MRAEAAFLQGRLTDAHIELESACARIQDNGQANMALCCDFLAWRLSLFAEMKYHCSLPSGTRSCCSSTMLPG